MNPLHVFLDLLYPPRCVLCRKLLAQNETDLCRRCRCELPEVGHSVKRGEFYEACYPLYYYEAPLSDAVRRMKFHGRKGYTAAFGRLLAMQLLRQQLTFDYLTWVPVSRKRRRERGFDQSERMARQVAEELKVPLLPTLKKKRDCRSQTAFHDPAARKANVSGVFDAVQPERFAGKRLLLLDDVLTTGATLSECSRVLLTAGAASVQCITLCVTHEKATSR